VVSADPVATPGSRRQALLALAHLRNGDTYTHLACGFEIGVATAWRYVREAVDLLAATADDLDTAMTHIRALAYAILDGTLIPIDRVADQKPSYSGKHRRHGVNVQVIADPARPTRRRPAQAHRRRGHRAAAVPGQATTSPPSLRGTGTSSSMSATISEPPRTSIRSDGSPRSSGSASPPHPPDVTVSASLSPGSSDPCGTP